MRKKYVIIGLIVVSVLIIIISITIMALKNSTIEYSENGQPIIVTGEGVLEENEGENAPTVIPEDNENDNPEENSEGEILTDENVELSTQKWIKMFGESDEMVKKFDEILYKYYDKERIDRILEDMDRESQVIDDMTGVPKFPSGGRDLLMTVVDIVLNRNPIEEDAQILRDISRQIVSFYDIDDPELEEKIIGL